MTSAAETEPLLAALEGLGEQIGRLRLPLEVEQASATRRLRRAISDQLDDYLLPRLRQVDAPLLAVVGGPTGAGKSTLVNSLVGAQVSAAGVLRPTTRAPVLVCNPADVRWFEDDRILPGLTRTTGGHAGPGGLELSPTDAERVYQWVAPQIPEGWHGLSAPLADKEKTKIVIRK